MIRVLRTVKDRPIDPGFKDPNQRAYYELRTYWIKEFNYEDYIDLKFVGPVVPLKWSHPVAKVVDIGKNTYRVLFRNRFQKYPVV